MAWLRRKRDDAPADPGPQGPTAVDSGDSPDELGAKLHGLVRLINAHSGQMPGAAVVQARRLTDTLREIIETSTVRPLDVYTLLTVRGTLDDYLPTTLHGFLGVDPQLRLIARPSGRTPMAALLEQLDALQTAADSVLIAVRSQDADALMTQGSFLRTKFSGSDLDLP